MQFNKFVICQEVTVVLGKWCNVVDATAVVSAETARALKQKGPAPTVFQAKTINVATDLA